MKKKKLVMATLLAITLTLSIVSTTVVHAQEETQSTNTESLADESEQSTYETVAAESESIEPDIPEYTPSVTLASSTWTGQSDIVLDTQAKGGNVKFQESYIYVESVSLGGIDVTPEMNLDSDGNGTIVFKNSDLQNATMFGSNGEAEVDWSKIDQIEISIGFELDGQYKSKFVYVPVDFIVSEPETETESEIEPEPTEKVTITNESGIIMELPEGAPDHLELKVNVSNGADEKSAVQKVIQIDSDKIKTFDLSLLFNGQPYEYNGQFTSTVSLPVPDGWNLNELALYYFNENTKEVIPVLFSVDRENEMVVFATNHFSKYILVQKDVTREDATKEDATKDDTTKKESTKVIDTPKTGDSANVGLYTSLFIISGLCIIVFALLRKKKVSENR